MVEIHENSAGPTFFESVETCNNKTLNPLPPNILLRQIVDGVSFGLM